MLEPMLRTPEVSRAGKAFLFLFAKRSFTVIELFILSGLLLFCITQVLDFPFIGGHVRHFLLYQRDGVPGVVIDFGIFLHESGNILTSLGIGHVLDILIGDVDDVFCASPLQLSIVVA